MPSTALSELDYLVFGAYFVALVVIGFVAGARQPKTADEYFLAGRRLPWYVVGASFIGSNISTEHFIGMVGSAYVYGICVAQWEWGNIFAFSVLIWLFIPFLLSSQVFTAPEFLEKRFNSACRLFFAILTVIANVTAFLAAVLYAAAIGMKAVFNWPEYVQVGATTVPTEVLAIVGIGGIAGSYAIYGGLRSVAWTDLFQVVVMVAGGVLVTLLGLEFLGNGDGLIAGWKVMIARNSGEDPAWLNAIAESGRTALQRPEYDRLQVFQPISHSLVPWPTIFFGWLSVSIWYNCINQFMIQRVLAAKDEWHARMGIVFAGFMKIFMPLIVVIPGLIYFAMKPAPPSGLVPDQVYATMIGTLVDVGLRGLLLAALFGAIQSTIDSVLNSTSTIVVIDIYKRYVHPDSSDATCVILGKIVAAMVLIASIIMAPMIRGEMVFEYIQNLYAYFAPPFAAVFLLGILWKRANASAATLTIPSGIAFGLALQYTLPYYFEGYELPFTLRSIITWVLSMLLMVVISLLTPPPPPEKVGPTTTLNWQRLNIFQNLGRPWYRSIVFWYGLFVAGVIACYTAFSGLLF